MIEALGVEPLAVVRSQFDYLVEVKREADVRALAPDFTRLRHIATRGVIVTARAVLHDFDFNSRLLCSVRRHRLGRQFTLCWSRRVSIHSVSPRGWCMSIRADLSWSMVSRVRPSPQ